MCHCSARKEVRSVGIVFSSDPSKTFALEPDDLFEPAQSQRSAKYFRQRFEPELCVFQVQQRPIATAVDDPFGLLGAPLLDRAGRLGVASAFGAPASGGLEPPQGLKPTPKFTADATQHGAPLGADPPELMKDIMDALSSAKEGEDPMKALIKGGVIPPGQEVKEVVVQRMGDGTKCETDVTRSGTTGKIVDETTKAFDKSGNELKSHKVLCKDTQGILSGSRRLIDYATLSNDLWVIGDVFLRRRALVLDFGERRLGVAEFRGQTWPGFHSTSGLHSSPASASIIPSSQSDERNERSGGAGG